MTRLSLSGFASAKSLVAILATCLLLCGFWWRYHASTRHILSPDECMHLDSAREPTLDASFRSAWNHAHPPLYFLFLHAWGKVAESDVALRFPVVLFGTSALAFLFLWVRSVFGVRIAIFGLCLAATNPMLISLSAELRGYALMHAALSAALLLQCQYLRTGSVHALAGLTAMLSIACLSEYCAFFCVFGLAVLFLVQASAPSLRRRILPWCAGQALIALQFGLLYFTHLRGLRASDMGQNAVATWLNYSHFQAGVDQPLVFLATRTYNLVMALTGLEPLHVALSPHIEYFALPLLAVSLLSAWKLRRSRAFWALLAALAAALAANASAALLRLFPYGGTRHSAEHLVLLLPLSAILLTVWLSEWKPALVALAAVLFVAQQRSELFRQTQWIESDLTERAMRSAVAAMREDLRPHDLIFANQATALYLSRYLPAEGRRAKSRTQLHTFPIDGVTIYFDLAHFTWNGDPRTFSEAAARQHERMRRPPSMLAAIFAEPSPVSRRDAVPGFTMSDYREHGRRYTWMRLSPQDPPPISQPDPAQPAQTQPAGGHAASGGL